MNKPYRSYRAYRAYLKSCFQLCYIAGLCKTDTVIPEPGVVKFFNGKSLCEAKRKPLPQ
jgi:hypothetical protein